VVICLVHVGADLHMAQLMPLPLTVSCFSKIQIGFTFLVGYRLTRVVLEKGPLNGCVCMCVCYAAFNAPCVGHKDDELQARGSRATAIAVSVVKIAISA